MSVKTDTLLLSPDVFRGRDLGAAVELVREAGGEYRGIFQTPWLRGLVYFVGNVPTTKVEGLMELGAMDFR